MAELASKFNVGCVSIIQISALKPIEITTLALVQVIKITFAQIVSIKSFPLSMCVDSMDLTKCSRL